MDQTEVCGLKPNAPQGGRAAPPAWIGWSLRAAAVYNVIGGAWAVFFPAAPWAWLGMAPPNYLELWQCIGMIVGVYGIGYWIAARDPVRHWPIVLVGLLGKILGPIGTLLAALRGTLPWSFGLINLANDLVWWLPFAAALYYAWRIGSAPTASEPALPFAEAIAAAVSQRGRTLAELAAAQPVLVLFMRHAGCTFCREALADVAQIRAQLAARGVGLAIVHMSGPASAEQLLARYSLDGVDHFSDPAGRLYRAFELSRGAWWQVLGPQVWLPGLKALVRHGLGAIEGDGFQMPGVFLLHRGKIVAAYRHRTAADRPDYLRLATGGQV